MESLMDNDTLAGNGTLNSINLSHYNLHMNISLGPKTALGIGLGACCLLIIVGNCLVIAAIALNRKLRTVTNYFVLSLALADLTLGVLVLPLSLMKQLEDRWLLGKTVCNIWAATDVLCCTASILSLCAISVDRYMGVTKPLKHRNMSKKKAWMSILAIWLISLTISIVGPLVRSHTHSQPLHSDNCEVIKSEAYVLASVTLSFYIPALIILIIYIRIYREAKKQYTFLSTGVKHVKSGENNSSSPLILRAHSRKMSAATASRSTRNSETYKESLTAKLNDIDSKNRKEKPKRNKRESFSTRLADFTNETRAAKTLGIVVGIFLLCWFPFFFILPIDAFYHGKLISKNLFDFVFWLGYCNSMLNPMVYALRMKEFKRTFVNILCCRCGSKNKSITIKSKPGRVNMVGGRGGRFMDNSPKQLYRCDGQKTNY